MNTRTGRHGHIYEAVIRKNELLHQLRKVHVYIFVFTQLVNSNRKTLIGNG